MSKSQSSYMSEFPQKSALVYFVNGIPAKSMPAAFLLFSAYFKNKYFSVPIFQNRQSHAQFFYENIFRRNEKERVSFQKKSFELDKSDPNSELLYLWFLTNMVYSLLMVTFFTFALINRQMDLDQRDISILQADLNRLRRLSNSTGNPNQNNGKLDQSKTASPVEKPQHRSHNIEEN